MFVAYRKELRRNHKADNNEHNERRNFEDPPLCDADCEGKYKGGKENMRTGMRTILDGEANVTTITNTNHHKAHDDVEHSEAKQHAVNNELAHAVEFVAQVKHYNTANVLGESYDEWIERVQLYVLGTQLKSCGAQVPPTKAKKAVRAKMRI